MYTLLVLTYSAFCLTSLDTATRLARFMFQEFWLEPGETPKDIKNGFKKMMVNICDRPHGIPRRHARYERLHEDLGGSLAQRTSCWPASAFWLSQHGSAMQARTIGCSSSRCLS